METNAIQQVYEIKHISNAAKSTLLGNNVPESANNNEADSVNLSSWGKTLSELPPIMLPTQENVKKLSEELSKKLKDLFDENGINPEPPIEFNVNSFNGAVSVKNNRSDTQEIGELIKKNPELELQIHNVGALSSHVVAISKAIEAGNAYAAAQSESEINSVIRKYSSVYKGNIEVTDFSLIFNGSDIQVNANDKPWLSTKNT